MKTRYVLAIILVAVIGLGILIAASKPRSTDIRGLTYEQLCKKNGDQWMVMEPWIGGKKVSDNPCDGCMIADNHFCTPEEYVGYVKNLPTFVVQETTDEAMSRAMIHEAMTAHVGYENSTNIHTYKVGFIRPESEALKEATLTFTINELDSGNPVSNIEIAHDKIMHVVLVRNDLKYFDHIHTQQANPGIFSVPYVFSAPGSYRVWIDFTINGMQHIVDFDLNVSGSPKSEPERLYGINVMMNLSDAITIGEASKISFIVTESGNPVAIIEKFLAANAHMIVIDEGLEEFGHAHDEQFDRDNILAFEHNFIKSGLHKIWVQFSVNGTDRTAEFAVNV